MPAIFLYLATTVGLLFVWQRYVQPITRAAAIALVLLPLCFTGGALLTGRVYAPIDMPFMSEPLQDYKRDHGIEGAHNGTLSDLYMQMIPWQGTVRATLLRGEWPLWNPHLLCGSILAANMQSAVYDPLTWLGLLVPQAQALTYGAAMSFFFAAFFTFFFARALGLGELAALVAAAAYTFSGMLAFFIGWPLGRAWALFPFVMLGVRFVVRETSVRAAVLLTTAFVLALVAGHPESVLHLCTLGAIYGVYEVAVTRRWKAIPLAVLCGAVALLLTAIALLPFFAVMNETTEHEVRKGYFAQIELPSSRLAVERRAGVSLLPWYGGQPERANLAPMWEPTSIRTGSIALALALAALLLAPRRDTWFFLMLAVFCTWVGLNAWPVAHFLHTLPLFDITLNERLANAAAFSIAILAAIAVDAWPATRERTWRAAGAIAAVGVALGIATFMLRDAQIAQGVKPGLITMLTLAELVPLAAIALLLLLRTPQRIALPVVIGLLLFQRTVEDGGIYPKLPASAFYPPIPILDYLQNDRGEPFRIAPLHFAFLPDAAALYGLDDVRGYEAMSFRRLEETYPLWAVKNGPGFNNVPDKSRPFLSLMNVKYAIGSLREQPDEQWKLVLQDRESRLFLNTRVLPRAFVPRSIEYIPQGIGLPSPVPPDLDFAQRSWISAPEYASHAISNGPGTLRIKRPANGEFDIAATMENDGWVVISESAWPGWRAYVDGKRVKLHFANHAFLGVFVPKGTHRLRVVYQPAAFTRGRNITLLTVVALVVFFLLRRRRLQQPRAVSV